MQSQRRSKEHAGVQMRSCGAIIWRISVILSQFDGFWERVQVRTDVTGTGFIRTLCDGVVGEAEQSVKPIRLWLWPHALRLLRVSENADIQNDLRMSSALCGATCLQDALGAWLDIPTCRLFRARLLWAKQEFRSAQGHLKFRPE